jgi:hypothetical protein
MSLTPSSLTTKDTVTGDAGSDTKLGSARESVPTVVDTPYASQDAGTLSCTMGNWTGEPSSYSYVWKLGTVTADASDKAEYALKQEDVGKTASCVVTATNSAGSTAAPASNSVEVAPFVTEQFYFHDIVGAIYKAESRRNPADSLIPFPGDDIEQHMSKDFAGNVTNFSVVEHDAPQTTVAREALKYSIKTTSTDTAAAIVNSGGAAAGSVGIRNSNTAAASGDTKVSTTRK